MEMESDEVEKCRDVPNPLCFCVKLVRVQAEIVWTCMVSLASPFLSVISLLFHGSEVVGRGVVGRVAMGVAAAVYVSMVLMMVGMVAAVVGVGLVRGWVEEPVDVRESLQFDYTYAHPTAVYSLREGVPVGHTIDVSLVLLIPESDYNREVGIFQLSAELISLEGKLMAKSSHPRMLVFRSWPIRYARTLVMGVPLLLGMTSETQRVSFASILKHKEGAYPRTEKVRITLIPRAGTSSLPHFYQAHLHLKSRPPLPKRLLYKWKWTCCVWATIYVFLLLLMLLLFFFKPLLFPALRTRRDLHNTSNSESVGRRNKRKQAALLHHSWDGDGMRI